MNKAWRRYYPPGYNERFAGRDDARATLVRHYTGSQEWWVSWVSGPETGSEIGPFPSKAAAWAAYKLLTS
ncbi:hypothetical protein [Paraburkholderia sp. BL10I2N1]|uniref:hypothetical protein n=1 Tax=Paraburkholderia sp. BL10I2N1 TaxID=1938796 RepID=UPI001414D848|nr:hypothetical protein [Paraburkholderia sp. BL10I2N1]